MRHRDGSFGHTASGLVVALLATGCVSTSATLLDTSVRPQAICPDGVKVYLSSADLPSDAVQLALLKSSGDDDLTTEGGMINSQRQKAAEVGATGFVLGDQKDASAGAKFASALFGTSKNRKGSALAIFAASDTARAYGICRSAGHSDSLPRTE